MPSNVSHLLDIEDDQYGTELHRQTKKTAIYDQEKKNAVSRAYNDERYEFLRLLMEEKLQGLSAEDRIYN